MTIFLSYKSEDANLVRGVAERLMAGGTRVWFNEYQILPDRYEQFEAEIDAGLREATHAVVFTNRRWSLAHWCRHETKGLLSRLSADRIVEVCIPKEDEPHAQFPILAEGHPIIFSGDLYRPEPGQVQRLVDELAARLGLGVGRPTPVALGNTLRLRRYGISIDTGPFRAALLRTEAVERSNPFHGMRSLVLTGTVDGVEVVLDLHVWPFDSVLRDVSIGQAGAADDREVYRAYLAHGRRWLGEHEKEWRQLAAKGLHLTFVGGRSHLGLTYTNRLRSTGETWWERRYAISLELGDGMSPGEAGVVFAAKLQGSEAEQLARFCRLAPQLEALVQSLAPERTSRAAAAVNHLPIVAGRIAYVAATVALLVFSIGSSKPPAWRVLGAAVAGISISELLNVAVRPSYRRLLWTWQPLSDELAESAYERVSRDLVFNLFTAPFQTFVQLAGYVQNHPVLAVVAGVLIGLCIILAVSPRAAGAPRWPEVMALASAAAIGGGCDTLAVASYVARKRRGRPSALRVP